MTHVLSALMPHVLCAIRAFLHHVPYALCALVHHAPQGLRTVEQHVLHALRAFEPKLSYTLCVSLAPFLHQVFHFQLTLKRHMSRSSRVSRLFCFYYFSCLSCFLDWATVYHYNM